MPCGTYTGAGQALCPSHAMLMLGIEGAWRSNVQVSWQGWFYVAFVIDVFARRIGQQLDAQELRA